MSRVKKTVSMPLWRLKRFLALFARNPRGIIGLVIIALFTVMAIGAPLLTPYDPIRSMYVGGSYSAPVWLKYLPATLGGRPGASENFRVEENANFNSSLTGWNYTVAPHVSITHSPDTGVNEAAKGSAKITFQRNETDTTYGRVSVTLSKEFSYPFSEKPRKFLPHISLFADGTTHVYNDTKTISEIYYDPNKKDPKTGKIVGGYTTRYVTKTTTLEILDINMTIFVYLQRLSDGKIFLLWPYQDQLADYLELRVSMGNKIPQPGTIYNASSTWIDSNLIRPDSDALRYPDVEDITSLIFNPAVGAIPGTYRLGINLTFQDFPSKHLEQGSKQVESTLYVDDFYISFEGTVWGLMGTNHYGNDLWSQLVYGSRISLYVGLLASILSVGLGLIVGLAAGYMGRYVDEILMRFSDMLLVLPGLPLIIVLVAVMGPQIENLIIVIGLIGWMGFARLVRSQVLTVKERPFVEAAKAVGAGRIHIISTHILPSVMSLVYITLATSVPGAIVAEAALSFLGFYDPNRMTWGRMLYDVQASGAAQYWWWVIPPGLCIALLGIAFILLGFGLDEVFNPRLRTRR